MMRTTSTGAAIALLLAWSPLSAATYYVNQLSPSASDGNAGSADKPFKSISAAAAIAGPGDKVLVAPGIYRERVAPAKGGTKGQPVIYQSEPAHGAVVCGSNPWKPRFKADPLMQGLSFTPLPQDQDFTGANPFRTRLNVDSGDAKLPLRPGLPGKLLPYSLGQIFADGDFLVQAQTIDEVKRVPGTWIVSDDGESILVHARDGKTLEDSHLEITMRDRLFAPHRRGLGFVEVRGFIFERCANQGPFPQRGAVSVRSGYCWTIENNIIRFAQTIGLDCGSEGWNGKAMPDTVPEDQRFILSSAHMIRNNLITDNGLCGLAGWNHSGTKIISNVLERNNRLSLSYAECSWEEWAAIKMHGSDVLVEGNLIRNNSGPGIWFDNGYDGARITRNIITGNQGTGVFIELGAGRCMIDNNIIANTSVMNDFYNGTGIYTHDASGITIAHNLIVNNASSAVRMTKVSNRMFADKPAEASDETIVNNILSGNNLTVELPYPNKYSRNCREDWNLLNKNGPFKFIYCIGQPEKKDLEAQITAKAGETLTKDVSTWSQTGRISMQLWRTACGWGLNSKVVEGNGFSCNFKPWESTVTMMVRDEKLMEIKCPIVDGIDADFTGKPLSKAHVIPGPFQDLKSGANYYVLFPVLNPNADQKLQAPATPPPAQK